MKAAPWRYYLLTQQSESSLLLSSVSKSFQVFSTADSRFSKWFSVGFVYDRCVLQAVLIGKTTETLIIQSVAWKAGSSSL